MIVKTINNSEISGLNNNGETIKASSFKMNNFWWKKILIALVTVSLFSTTQKVVKAYKEEFYKIKYAKSL